MKNEILSPVQPALNAVEYLRKQIKKRIGKEGGNLNALFLSHLDTIESTLLQIQPLSNMITTLNQQTEVAVHAMRSLSRVQALLPSAGDGNDTANDNGESETKGQ